LFPSHDRRGQEIKTIISQLDPKLSAETTKPTYEEIELTEEETIEALRLARENKFYKLRQQEYSKKVSAGIDWSIPNARELYERLRRTIGSNGKPYQVNDKNKKVIEILCLYFANDPRLLELHPTINPNKGICLTGNVGVGKTHLLNFFATNPKQSYKLVTCRDVAEKFRLGWEYEGINAIEYYSSMPAAKHPQPYNQELMGFCFGDLGYEDDKNNYGNKMNVMEEIIFRRYENKIPFNMTHFTTNLNGSEIKARYGDRIYDRLKETMNWIVLEGKSFRE